LYASSRLADGVILAQFYNPDPAAANASVRDIVEDVWAGRFIRGLHFWVAKPCTYWPSCTLLRIHVTGSYKRPRKANWLIGVTMFALTIAALFTRHRAQVGPGRLRGAQPPRRPAPRTSTR